MTLKEAKKILKKEGFHMALANKVIYQNGAIREFEKPEVCEAIKVANANRWVVGLSPMEWDERKARLKKEHEENAKAPGSGEEQPKEGNHAIKEAASQFNDALLDEQGMKIKHLTKKITRLNKIIHKKNMKIEELKEHLKESKESAMKYASLLSDAYEELRELKKNLANKVVDKIDAQALKSAESALAWKEKKIADKDEVIAELREKLKSINMNRHNERIYKKQLAEKDEVIAELDKELDEANKHQQQAYRSCADKNKEIRALKLQISALEKRGNGIDWKRNADAIKLYVNRASHERLWSPISQDICNDQELSFIINHGGKRVKYALRFDGTDIVYECSDPDKKPRIQTPEEPKHDNIFEDFINKTIGNYNRRAAELGCAGSKDGNGIFDQMVGTDIAEEGEDYYGKIVLCDKICTRKIEEIEIEKAVKLVRKAMKEGHTVTINYKD